MIADTDLLSLEGPLLIVGGAYCGKSSLAHQALFNSKPAEVYGTAYNNEDSFKARINELKAQRPSEWHSYDDLDDLAAGVRSAMTPQILVDSINQWLSGLFVRNARKYSVEQLQQLLEQEVRNLQKALFDVSQSRRVVIVTSEIASGMSPPDPRARLYRQTLARLNQALAHRCQSVVLVNCGIPRLIKSNTAELSQHQSGMVRFMDKAEKSV